MDKPISNGPKRVKLTKRLIDALPARAETYTVWDQEIPGFGVRVMSSGKKSFVLKYSIHRQQRWITLGRFGDLTLEEGRNVARSRRGEVAKGIDPSEDIRASRTAPTMKELIDRFIEEHVQLKTKASTARGYIRYLRHVIEPNLGRMLVKDVSPAEVAKFHHDLRNTPRQANQAVAILRKMFNCAEIWQYRPLSSNPCTHIEKNPERKRERFLNTQELQALGEALASAEKTGAAPLQAITAIRLLILTGARHSEILELKWMQVDLQRKVLTFSADQHKTGRKTGAKVIPLNAPAIEIIKSVPTCLGNPYVIRGEKPGSHFVGLQKVWERIRSNVSAIEAKKVEDGKKTKEDIISIENVRIHDLRHTFASVGVSQGLSLPVVGSLLGHSQPSVTQRYAHLAEDPRASASEEIGAEIARGLLGERNA